MLNWATRFSIFVLLDNNHYSFSGPAFECILAAGFKTAVSPEESGLFTNQQCFFNNNRGKWVFGHAGYNLKNEIEKLQSEKPNDSGFPDYGFFVPEHVLIVSENGCRIISDENAEKIFTEIVNTGADYSNDTDASIKISSKFSKEEYINSVNSLKRHIQYGDCYEINFCQEFFSEKCIINPVEVFQKLNTISPNPFAALYKWESSWCMCASPERYLQKHGDTIISQPIKGTSKRNPENKREDEAAKQYLLNSQKEKSENVMVVDLVRNDISKVCKKGTVTVDELYGIYSFPQVHQMISTISGSLKDNVAFIDIIKATFPMGSMTGAPKKRVMELIEQYEKSNRGLFSGSIGYINPEGDFDFNVVIRSIFYNQETGYLSFQTGGGITIYSDAEKEYAESLLKAEAIMKAIS